MFDKFEFVLPTTIKYGADITATLSREVKSFNAESICIVTDKGLIKAGIVDKIIAAMDKEHKDNLLIFDEVMPNPRDTTVQDGYELARRRNVDILVAIGGGSSMDVAKAMAILLENGGTVQDYEGLDTVKGNAVPVIAIPTTVGTGSEVTFFSVITDTKRHFKMSILSTKIAPKVALVDPLLVEDLPTSIVASTGMDALTHAIEGYTCRLAEPITDATGIYAIKMIAKNLEKAVVNNDKTAKSKMLMASLLAGICFGNSDIASVHAMAEALGGMYDTPHGIANAILLPYVMEYNYDADMKKFKEVAIAMGQNVVGMSDEEAARAAVDAVKDLSRKLNIPTLKDIGADPYDFEELAQNSSVNVSSESNVKDINKEIYLKLFEKAYES